MSSSLSLRSSVFTSTALQKFRFCPKFTFGAATSARIEVLNRNPTITVEALDDEVNEGEPARFRLTRIWTSDWLQSSVLLGASTTFEYTTSTVGDYVTSPPSGQKSFAPAATEIIVEIPTVGDGVAGEDGLVTFELLAGREQVQSGNIGGHYEVYDHLDGVTPPGGNSRVASVRILNHDEPGIEVSATALTVPEGDNRTYTVVLESQPAGPVTVTPSVAGSADVTVSGALTFTAQNWNRAQTVTVSAAQDADAANDAATVSHAVSGGGYGSVTVPDVTVTVEDDDEQGVRTSATALTVPEGDSRTYTVALRSQPVGPVTVTPSVAGSADVTVSGALTFTAQNWNQAQTVTISAAQDADAANDAATVSHAVSGGGYGSVTAPDVEVTVEDDDEQGVRTSATALTVPEGDSRTYTVVLGSQPAGPVTVTPSVAGSADVTVSGALTFTAQNWNRAQTVTVSAAQDADAENDAATVSHAVSGGGYGSVTVPDVTVTVSDDETASVSVALTVSPSSVDETAGATAITVTGTLNGAARNSDTAVTVTVSAGTASTGDFAAVQDFTLTITAGQISGTATFRLTPVDDTIDEADETVRVAGTVQGLTVTAGTVTVEDDDEQGVRTSATALTVPEGDSRTYTVALRSQPVGPVTVTPSVAGSADVTVSGALTFTAQNWNQAQTVTVSAAQDADAANDAATVSHAVSGGGYGSVTAPDVEVKVEDDDEQGVRTSATALTVPEGDSRTYTVALGSQPAGPVTVTPSVAGSADVTMSGALTFTAQNWDQAQTVTVSAAQDADAANDAATVSHAVSGGGYGSVTVPDVTVTVEDDDEQGVRTSATALTVPEGDNRTYTVVLESQPAGPVTVTPSVAGSADVTVSGALTFTAQNWNRAQTVTVSAAQDADAANDAATVSHAVSGGDYSSVTAPDVEVTVEDLIEPGIEVSATALTVPEGDSRTYTVVLGSQPAGPVTVRPSVAGSADVTVSGALTFTAQNWNRAQTVTVSAAQDADAANDAATVSHAVSGGGYGSVTVPDVTVTVEDDDEQGVRTSATALTVPEGDSRTYTVALRSQPAGPVTVTPSVAGSADVTVSGALTFTAQNWNQAQTVTVSAAQDADAENDAATVSHAVSGGGYGSVTVPDVAVTVEDDDTASTAVALTVSPGTVNEDAGAAAIAVTGTLNEATRTSDTAVTVTVSAGTASTGDFAAVPDFTLTIAAGRTSGTATFMLTPVDDSIDEPDETIVVEGTSPGLEVTAATVSIVNEDSMPKAWIARFGRTVAEQVLKAADIRMSALPRPGVEAHVAGHRVGNAGTAADGAVPWTGAGQAAGQVAGRSLNGWPGRQNDLALRSGFGSRPVTGHDLLTGSSFSLTKGTEGGGLISLWGRGAMTRFNGREERVSLDGEVTSGMLGADWTWDDTTAGLILSHSRGVGGYRGASDSGSVSSFLNGFFPWGRYALNERLTVWGVAGYGVGELTLTPDGETPVRTDLDLAMFAAGLRGALAQASETAGMDLAWKADGLIVRTSAAGTHRFAAAKADVTRLRLALEGSRPFRLEGGATLTPGFEIGARHDGGDAETGFGVDIGGGLSWVHPASGISAEVSGRGLLTHDSRSFRNFGISGSFAWDPDPASNRGPSLSLRQTAGGAAAGGMDALLGRETLAGLAANDNGSGLQNRRLELRMGYGFSAFGDRFTSTPEIGFGLSSAGRDYRLGWRLSRMPGDGGSLGLSVEARRRESAGESVPPEHEVRFGLAARF